MSYAFPKAQRASPVLRLATSDARFVRLLLKVGVGSHI
jgi:hypothetical protein